MAKKQRTTKGAARTRRTTRKRATTRTPRARGTRDPRLPAPGGVLTRTFKGREVRVTVLDRGFRFEGKEWRSLTSIACSLTGYPVSGPHFFRIDAPAAATQPVTDAVSEMA